MKTAKQFWDAAEKRAFAINKTFIEIQQGPNPLTASEIKALSIKRPDVWGKFVPYNCPACVARGDNLECQRD